MKLANSLIAVTGATGFLGQYIVDELLRRGARVRAVVRNPARAPRLANTPGVELAVADLADRQALARGFAGADAVIGCAALFSLDRQFDWAANYAANKEGTANVFGAVGDAGIKRVIHVSSCAVYRPSFFKDVPEDHPRLKAWHRWILGAYFASKALAEEVAWQEAERLGLDLTVIRPSGIYGARDNNVTPVLRRLARWPFLVVPTLHMPMVYAGDVAKALCQSLEVPDSIGRAYNCAGDPQRDLYEFYAAWKWAYLEPVKVLRLPVPGGVTFDITAATRDLGFSNLDFSEGWRQARTLEG